MNAKGPQTQGLLKHAAKSPRNSVCNLILSDFSNTMNAGLAFISSLPELKNFFALLPIVDTYASHTSGIPISSTEEFSYAS